VIADLIQGVMWLLIGVVVIYLSLDYNLGSLRDPGAGTLPFGLGCVFILLSIVLLLQTWLIKRPDKEQPLSFGPKYRRVFLIVLFLVLITFLFEPLGYIISVFLLITFSMLISDPKRWTSAFILGIVSSFASYMLFKSWLGVGLPKGLFYF